MSPILTKIKTALWVVPLVVVALSGSHYFVYNEGKSAAQVIAYEQIIERKEKEGGKILELIDENKRLERDLAVKVEELDQIHDSCLDTNVHPDALRLWDDIR